MALDDKVFQSAIARINKLKTKQSSIPQVQVFEDPPHLKKSNIHIPTNEKFLNSVSFESGLKEINQLNDKKVEEVLTIHKPSISMKNEIALIKNDTNRVHNRGTEYSTEQGTEKGTQQFFVTNSVLKKGTKQGTNQGTKSSTEIGNKISAPLEGWLEAQYEDFYKRPYEALNGISKKIVDVLFEICRKFGLRETPPLPLSMIVRLCNEKKNSVKVTRQRLLDEGILMTKNPDNTPSKGRSGMLIYKIREDIFDEINNRLSLLLKTQYDAANQGTKWGTEYSTKCSTTASSSSSSNITTTTTTLPLEWKTIDVSPLKEINFGIHEIKNIFKKCPTHITPQIVQNSIYQFAFGMKHNSERYKKMYSPSGVLVKTLCEGNAWLENDYVSHEDKIKIEKDIKLTKIIEEQFKESKFLDWFNTLDEEKKEELVPATLKASMSYSISKSVFQKEHSKKYFDNKIWPEILLQLKNELAEHSNLVVS